MSTSIASLTTFDTCCTSPPFSKGSSLHKFIVVDSASQKCPDQLYYSPSQLKILADNNNNNKLNNTNQALQEVNSNSIQAIPAVDTAAISRSTSSSEPCQSSPSSQSSLSSQTQIQINTRKQQSQSESSTRQLRSNAASADNDSNATITPAFNATCQASTGPRFSKKPNIYQLTDPVQRFFEQDLNLKFAEDNKKFLGKSISSDGVYALHREFVSAAEEDGIKIYYSNFKPLHMQPYAQILVVHGFCEHSGLYINFADYFVREGFEVHLYDQRGFGYSGGVPRNSSTEEFQRDLTTILSHINNNNNNTNASKALPLYVYGHSTGSLGALIYFMLNPQITLAGFISLNVFSKVPKYFGVNNDKKWLVRFLLLFYEDLLINSKINLSALCKNSYHIKKLIKDGHIQPHLTLRMAHSMMEQCDFLEKNSRRITWPLLLVHGKEDVVAKYTNSMQLFRDVSSSDKDCKIIDDGFHQPHLDTSAAGLHSLMNGWLSKRITSKNIPIIERNQLESVNIGCRMLSLSSEDLVKVAMSILAFVLWQQRKRIASFLLSNNIKNIFKMILAAVVKLMKK